MSHAESVHTLQPAAGATAQIVQFASGLTYEAIPDEARHYARRHLLDTVGVMIAGAGGTIATQAETVIKSVRADGKIPVAGRTRRADLLDAAFLGGTAAHGIELDDGYRHGSAHCGCVVIPAALSVSYDRRASGRALLAAIVAGYETNICLARAMAPELRQRGFHPTSAVGPFGAAMATAKLRGLSETQFANAMGIAASSAAGLFAFVNGGGDIKRLHAGHASREGIQAALLAEQGVEGPPGVIEARDGFMQAFAFGRIDKARPVRLPPQAEYGITDCYIKPYACCRHIQPAVEATFGLLNDEAIAFEDINALDVETYKIAAEHAHVPWDDFASAQLSFPYLVGLAARYRAVKFEHFDDKTRQDPAFADFARKLTVTAPTEIDQLYPKLRPARVTVTTAKGKFVRQADEAWGSRLVPLDDEGLIAKFLGLVGPVLGDQRAKDLSERLWAIDAADDVAPLIESLAK
ncbi:MAG: MmgE/PrpD family protein [Rhizobiales bacterium]|nr:MmgE/PrpD family protein [Hyphomicrobiales bacterium]